jgi:hypothetical protein
MRYARDGNTLIEVTSNVENERFDTLTITTDKGYTHEILDTLQAMINGIKEADDHAREEHREFITNMGLDPDRVEAEEDEEDEVAGAYAKLNSEEE